MVSSCDVRLSGFVAFGSCILFGDWFSLSKSIFCSQNLLKAYEFLKISLKCEVWVTVCCRGCIRSGRESPGPQGAQLTECVLAVCADPAREEAHVSELTAGHESLR